MLTEPWHIQLLGGLAATQHNTRIERFRSRKVATLFAYLAIHTGVPTSRELLGEMLWPDEEIDTSRNRLRVTLASLRKQLEPPPMESGSVLVASRSHVSLRVGQIFTDVDQFRRAISAAEALDDAARTDALRAAVGLYRGELLPGFYDEWIYQERRALEHQYQETLTDVISRLMSHGNTAEALPYALSNAAIDPLDEQTQRLLIEVYAALGHFARANEVFQALRVRMIDELGVEPSPETAQLVKGTARTLFSAPPDPVQNRSDLVSETWSLTQSHASSPPTIIRIELPNAASSFHGRQSELTELQLLLTEELKGGENALDAGYCRLVTLTGLGGIGKTRLGLQTALLCASKFPGGAWFVPLAEVEDSRQVSQAIADSLRIRLVPHRSIMDQIVDELRERTALGRALIVFDNFEQLVGPGSAIIEELLARVSLLTALVTSRRLLGLAAEQEFRVEPLDVPEAGAGTKLVSEAASVGLFTARAQAAQPDFQLTSHNASLIANLCNKLEGIPLAIELAAARIRLLTPTQMLAEMDQRFGLLVNRRATKDSRHRSLRATIERSVQVLPYQVREFFALLSVFRGSWNLESARAISESADALDMLDDLAGYSLIQTRALEGEMRYSMLETIREYAAGLVPLERQAIVDSRHAFYYAGWTEICESDTLSSQRRRVCAQYELEKENIRTAWLWALRNDTDCALNTISNLRWIFFVQHRLREGEEMILQSIQAADNPNQYSLARALVSLGAMRCFMDDFAGAAEPLRTAHNLLRDNCPSEARIAALYSAWVTMHEGDFDTAISRLNDARHSFAAVGKIWHEAACLNLMGFAACYAGRLTQARSLFADSRAQHGKMGDEAITAHCSLGVGRAAWMEGKLDESEAQYISVLDEFRNYRDLRGTAYALEGLARIASDRGNHSEAMRLTGASQRVRDQIASNRDPMDRAAHEAVMRAASEVLDEATRKASWESGYQVGERALD